MRIADGQSILLTTIAQSAFGNTAGTYAGTIGSIRTDTNACLSANYTITAALSTFCIPAHGSRNGVSRMDAQPDWHRFSVDDAAFFVV
jgi:hypothetical protein